MFNRGELSIVLNQETIFTFVNSSHLRILLRSYRIEKESEFTCGALDGVCFTPMAEAEECELRSSLDVKARKVLSTYTSASNPP